MIKTVEEDFINAQARKEITEFTDNNNKDIFEKAKMILLDKLTKQE